MAFLGFVVPQRDADSGVQAGVFQLASALRDSAGISSIDRDALHDQVAWFNEHLTSPERFNRSSSKGYYRRSTRGIAWFRDTANECISRMHRIKRRLETYGHRVDIIREEKVGYVVYEDELQVVAEPFSDTKIGE